MSRVQQLIDRQYGNRKFLFYLICSYSFLILYLFLLDIAQNYDMAMKNLRCSKEDEYYGIGTTDPVHEMSPFPILACRFAQKKGYEHFLALANEKGDLSIHSKKILQDETRYTCFAHNNAIFDLAWMFGEMKIVTASGDHTARLFTLEEDGITQERIFDGHTRSVKTVAFRKEDPAVFATGSRDGSIYFWDTRTKVSNDYIKKPDILIFNSHNVPHTPSSKSKKKFPVRNRNISATDSVTSIVFQDDNTLISCGAGDGTIKVWDMRKNYLVHKREPVPKYTLPYNGNTTRYGFSNLIVDSSGVKLYANCMDNNIYCYNISSYNPVPIMTYTGHQNSTFYIKSSLSADGIYLLSGSSDQNAYIWNVNRSTPIVSLTGHSAEVTCVAWCQKGNPTIVTCSDDMKYKIWQLHPGELPDDWHLIGSGHAVETQQDSKDKTDTKFNTPSKKRKTISTTPHSQNKRTKICENCQLHSPCKTCLNYCRSRRKWADGDFFSDNAHKSPRRLFAGLDSSNDLATVLEEPSFCPTANLPNFVLDGEAPHLRNPSPQKKADRDWLTKMRIEHSLRSRLEELSQPSSPKRDSSCVSPKASSSRKICQSPLLRYFKVTNNSRNCEHQCTPLANKNSPVCTDVRQVNL